MNPSWLTTSPVWTAAGWTMLHMTWVGVAIGALAALGRALMNSTRPESRYVAALAFLVVFALSPIAIFVRVFETESRPAIEMVGSVNSIDQVASTFTKDRESVMRDRTKPLVSVADPGLSDVQRSRFSLLVPYLPWFWLVGSLSALIAIVTGLIGVEQMRRSSRLVENCDIPRKCRVLADSLGTVWRVNVGICDRLAMPVLVGIVRPLILLPPAALCGWSVEQLEMVLLHELAHVKRWDNLVNLLQRVVESVLFFHPAVWWLSGWVRLERELCCDRLVVERLGRTVAYAEMLVALSGTRHRDCQGVLAMADRQVLTRIRRLLNLEDRSMKVTMPEGLGFLGAVVVGVLLVLGSHVAPPKSAGESDESVRLALRKAVDDVSAIPQDGLELDFTAYTLSNIARAQLKLDDRAWALATLRRASEAIGRFDPKKDDMEMLEALTEVPKHQHAAGDIAGARASLDRLTKLVDSLGDFSRVEELIQLTGTDQPRREKHEMNAFMKSELFMLIAEERMALGGRDQARALCRRAVAAIQPQQDILKPMVLAGIGKKLAKVGDSGGAREVVEQARQVAGGFFRLEDKEGANAYVAEAMAEIGDLDGALALVRTLGKHGQYSGFQMIIKAHTEEIAGVGLNLDGIPITLGAESMKVKDRATTRQAMLKIAQAVRDSGDALFQARMLAIIAHLQAKAGDFAGARQTADSIPKIKRGDFPGPSDGFYDAIKPGILALMARVQFDAGDKSGASEALRQALAMSRAIDAPGQKIVAQIVITQKLIECGDRDSADALLEEAIPFALKQPEPLRSRSLAMLVESQLKTGDTTGATKTTSAIRGYPGLEKHRALNALADWHEKAGDDATSKVLLREALHCMEVKAPEDAKSRIGKVSSQRSISAHRFIDFELEFDLVLAEQWRHTNAQSLLCKLGDIQEALRLARAMTGDRRQMALSTVARDLTRRGDVAGAVKLVESFESSDERLWAFDSIASAVQDGRAIK
jgi:beta-lactamase regulating signal transducer with metallopeptidase domain/tetratricopeptide (TPR) repeat protein